MKKYGPNISLIMSTYQYLPKEATYFLNQLISSKRREYVVLNLLILFICREYVVLKLLILFIWFLNSVFYLFGFVILCFRIYSSTHLYIT